MTLALCQFILWLSHQIFFYDSDGLQYWLGLHTADQSWCDDCGLRSYSGQCANIEQSRHPYPCCSCRASWTWIDGLEIALSSYMNWHHNQPTGNSLAARLRRYDGINWRWGDTVSSTQFNYICKRPLSVSTEPPLDPTTHDIRPVTTPQTGSSNECPGDDSIYGERIITS